jgi:GWxTD domain-containing protein
MRRLLMLATLLAVPLMAGAQERQDPMTEGILAFREERFDAAVRAFERALDADPANAEAHFLLARIFFETPLRDVGRAGSELDRALEIEPENVQYLVARMQQLRAESWNFIVEKLRESQRLTLARRILALDSTNAFAHEELGASFIRDFWRYRNAVMLPTMLYRDYSYRGRTTSDPVAARLQDQLADISTNPDLETEIPGDFAATFAGIYDAESVFLADEFDLEALESQGVPIQSLAGRAQRVYDRAVMHLNRALESDPRHRSVYKYLMEIFALKGEWPDALEMLQQMYVFFPDDPELWTYLGLAHHRAGNLDAAAKAFESAFEFMAADTRTAYDDLGIIVPEDEKAAYEADPAGYASRFWTSKDPRFLTPYNERKVEHYARITYADLLYGAPDVDLRGWETERGQILIRYGPPLTDVVIVPKSSSGVAIRSEERLPTATDPSQVADPILAVAKQGTGFDMFEEANTYNVWSYGDFKFVFEDPFRNGEYRMYSPPAAAIADGAQPWVNDYVIRARETFRDLPDRFEYEAPGREIELPFLVASFRGPGGVTDVLVNYAIPISEFAQPGDVINITASAGLFVVSPERDILAERRRTLYGLRTDQVVQFRETNLWVDSEELNVAPGRVDVSVEFETTSGNTVGVQRRSVTLPDFSGTDLSVSDVLLAYRVEETPDGRPITGADIVRRGLSIMPAPWSVFSHEQPIYLYFEVYNLAMGDGGRAEYEVEAALVPKEGGSGVSRFFRGLFGGGRGGVSAGLPISVASTEDGQYLILDASNQEEGLYSLRLRVRDRVSGREAGRELDLYLE